MSKGKDGVEMTTGGTDWGTERMNYGSSADGTPRSAPRPAEVMQQTTQQVQAATGNLADQAKQQIATQLNNQKERAATSLDTVAQAMRQTGQQLQDRGQEPVAGYATKAAEQVEQVTRYLNERDVVELRMDAERLVRNQPVLFLAGAFALGWLSARFFKSSAPTRWSNGSTSTASSTALPSSTRGPVQGTSYGQMPTETPATDYAPVQANVLPGQLSGTGPAPTL
jgi:hypothetical protein